MRRTIAGKCSHIKPFHACVTLPYGVSEGRHMETRASSGSEGLARVSKLIAGGGPKPIARGEMIMRAILAAVLALSVLTGITGAAFAEDDEFPRDFWERQQRNLP
jgi:hypothetical protein